MFPLNCLTVSALLLTNANPFPKNYKNNCFNCVLAVVVRMYVHVYCTCTCNTCTFEGEQIAHICTYCTFAKDIQHTKKKKNHE